MFTFNVSSKTSAEAAAESTAVALGFESPKRAVHIKIRFKKGASHKSWCSKKSSITDAAKLAETLIKGYRITEGRAKGVVVPARPIFDNYMKLYGSEVMEIVRKAFKTYSHWSVRDRAKKAGEAIVKDIRRRAYRGSLGLALNQGKYAQKKAARYGDAPFVATQSLLKDCLEVVVE